MNRTATLIASFLSFASNRSKQSSFDRWLSTEFKTAPYSKLDQGARDELYRASFAVMRFADLAMRLELAYQELARGFQWESKRKINVNKLEASLIRPATHARAGGKLAQMAAVRPEALCLWASWRAGLKPEESDRSREEFFRIAKSLLEASRSIEAAMLWHGFPDTWLGELEERKETSKWDEQTTVSFIAAMASRSPLWLRLNRNERAQEVLDELKTARLKVQKKSNALNVEGRASIYKLESFKNGLFEIQDLASQLLGASLAVRVGDRVWDCCAGEGGKTAQILSALGGKGFVYASDVIEQKLENLKLRIRRTGFSNFRLVPWDGTKLPQFGSEVSSQGGFDKVLVDAPCSSSGTWRRNPDAKLTLSRESVAEYGALQLKILSTAAQAVRPGGRLVYGTCSWFVEENEDVVSRFAASYPEFKLLSQTLHGSPHEDADTTFSAIFEFHGQAALS